MTEKLQFDLDVASNNLKKALTEAQNQIAKIEAKSGSIKFDPIFGNQFVADAKNASDNVSKVGEATKGAEKDAINFGTVMSFVYGNLIVNAVNSAKSAVTEFVSGSVDAYAEQETAIQKLNAALSSSSRFTSGASKDLVEFSENMQKNSRFSDDATASALGLLASMTKLDAEGLKRVTAGAADLAVRYGIDLATATDKLARGINGQTRGLKAFGIQVEDTGDSAKNFEKIMADVEKRFDGSAQKDLETYAGKMIQFKNEINESQESIGKSIIDTGIFQSAMSKAATAASLLSSTIKSISDQSNNSTGIEKLNHDLEVYKARLEDTIESSQTLAKSVLNNPRSQESLERDSVLLQQKIKDTEALIRAEESRSRQASPSDFSPAEKENTKSDELIAAETKTQSEITAIQEQELIKRQETKDQLAIIDIDNESLRSAAEIEAVYANAEAQANAKYEAKIKENELLNTEAEKNLANEKSTAEKSLAIEDAKGKRLIATKKQVDKEEKQLGQAKLDAFNAFSDLGLALSKKDSVAYKAIGTAQATINTYIGASKAFAELPIAVAPFAAAAIIATGLANVARINSVTAFESGGMLGVGSTAQGILSGGPSSGDKTLFRGNAGEVILNEGQQNNIANKLQNGNGVANINLYIEGRQIAYVMREQIQAGFKLS